MADVTTFTQKISVVCNLCHTYLSESFDDTNQWIVYTHPVDNPAIQGSCPNSNTTYNIVGGSVTPGTLTELT